MNSSRSRIDSMVRQSSAFENIQSFEIRGPSRPYETVADKLYQQALSLHSTTDRLSRRAIGTTLLGRDVEQVSYPLAYYCHMATTVEDFGDGWGITLRNGTVAATQRWGRTRITTGPAAAITPPIRASTSQATARMPTTSGTRG